MADLSLNTLQTSKTSAGPHPVHLRIRTETDGIQRDTLCGLVNPLGSGFTGVGRNEPCPACVEIAAEQYSTADVRGVHGIAAMTRAIDEEAGRRDVADLDAARPPLAAVRDTDVPTGPMGEKLEGPPPAAAPWAVGEPSDLERRVGAPMVRQIDAALLLIRDELMEATLEHGPMHSAHEAKGVIAEEYEEWWDEVKGDKLPGAVGRQQHELTQLGAMAARALVDVHKVGA